MSANKKSSTNYIDSTDKFYSIVSSLVNGDVSRIAFCCVCEVLYQGNAEDDLKKLKQYQLSIYPGPFKAEALDFVKTFSCWLSEDDAIQLAVHVLSQPGSPYYFDMKKDKFYHKMMVM